MIGISETTANVYVKLVGEKDETPRIPIHNKTTLEVEFECNNLGRLVVLAIGICQRLTFYSKINQDTIILACFPPGR